jgi:ABC-type nitrate/sulfonate/bicarbonate transport system permease component
MTDAASGASGGTRPFWVRIYPVVLALLAWEALALLVDDPLFLPRFSSVAATFWSMLTNGQLLDDTAASLSRALLGFAVAFVLGVPLGVLMGWSRRWDDFWSLLVSFSNPIPKIGLVPLFLLWFGIGEQSKVAVIAASALFPVLINTYNGVRAINPLWIWRARTVGVGRFEILWSVVLPAALPSIFTGARLGMALAWVILLAAEMVSARSGLGFRILYGQQMFETDVVFAGLLTISLLGFAFDRLIIFLSQHVCGWHFRLGQHDSATERT